MSWLKILGFIVVSMFTKNTPYEQEVENLRKSLALLDINHKIYPIENTGDWVKNCQKKSEIILKSFDNFVDKDIVWIDADAIVSSYPTFFEKCKADFSCYFLSTHYNDNELLAGTLFFKSTDNARKLVRYWEGLNKGKKDWDQYTLQEAFDHLEGKFTYEPLPIEYIEIHNYGKIQGYVENPIITHYQASRNVKKGRWKL